MAEEGSKDEERALLVAQINSLDEQQQRYLECDVLDKHNEDMTSLCDALRVNQSQSCHRLRRFNLIKEKKEDELENEQQTQQQAAGQQSMAMELQHSKHMQKLKDQRDRLHSVKRVTGAVAWCVVRSNTEPEAHCRKPPLLVYNPLFPSAETLVRLNELELLKEKVLSEKLKHQAAIHCLNDSLDETDECGNKQRQDSLERRIMEKTSWILRGDRARYSKQLESLEFLILEESSLLKEKADLEGRFSDLHLLRSQLKKDHEIALKSLINSKEEKTQVSNVLMKMQMKQKKAITTEHKQNKALRKRAPMKFPSKDGSDPTREQLQKERSRIGKLETIMQDGDIFVNQIMTGSEKSGWKTQWLLETLNSLCPPTLGERPRLQRPAQKEPRKAKREDHIQSHLAGAEPEAD
ncbi:hypothetical protein CesoFtcFv8_003294 [Champsocephalus esox]|uniref:Uncharacterized protein n=1 Tax=Champsocephalus esox TaxID=159716 RepID=A0AAN8CY21_9TELE|nr:hypothetical protein CesoFtcFv8_003294 [Champsocephalus esox]